MTLSHNWDMKTQTAKKGENQIGSDRAGRSHLTNQDDKRRSAGDVN